RLGARHLRLLLVAHKDFAVALLNLPAGNRAQCGGMQRFAGSQAEAGVVPRTAHRVVNQEPLRERSAIVGTGGADRENLTATAGEQHGLLTDMSQQHVAVGERVDRDSLRQIGAGRTGLFSSHRKSPEWTILPPSGGPSVDSQ